MKSVNGMKERSMWKKIGRAEHAQNIKTDLEKLISMQLIKFDWFDYNSTSNHVKIRCTCRVSFRNLGGNVIFLDSGLYNCTYDQL